MALLILAPERGNQLHGDDRGCLMSPKINELENLARDYCDLVDAQSKDDGEWLKRVASLLPKLNAAVTSLNISDSGPEYCMQIDLDERFELFTRLRKILGDRDGYWMEFDVAEDGQSMSGSLADDLTDIYCELKHGLDLIEGEPERAVEDLFTGYHLHWGKHLIDAERHLYDLRSRNQLSI
jgi:hypothetical protein